ncbi:MAG: NADH-quinone oxidoreductase subunit [Actinomycetota bacterium]|jgi:NADH-quinone oxidoreductase subunit C
MTDTPSDPEADDAPPADAPAADAPAAEVPADAPAADAPAAEEPAAEEPAAPEEPPAAEAAPAEETPVETDPAREAIVAQLTAAFADGVVETHIARGDMWVRVANDRWADVVTFCKTTLGFRFFDFLAGLDWLNNPGLSAEKAWDAEAVAAAAIDTTAGYAGGDTRFQVMCRLYNIDTHMGITLKVDLVDDAPTVASISQIFAGADWHERETWEMYGFNFEGHPGLRHLYLPGAFEGFPQRKDFPLLAREIKPWPGLVDKEPMPGEGADEDEEVPAE